MKTYFLIRGFPTLYLIYSVWCHPETNKGRKDGNEEAELVREEEGMWLQEGGGGAAAAGGGCSRMVLGNLGALAVLREMRCPTPGWFQAVAVAAK